MRVEQNFHRCRTEASPPHDFGAFERRASAASDTAVSNISRTRGQLSEWGHDLDVVVKRSSSNHVGTVTRFRGVSTKQ